MPIRQRLVSTTSRRKTISGEEVLPLRERDADSSGASPKLTAADKRALRLAAKEQHLRGLVKQYEDDLLREERAKEEKRLKKEAAKERKQKQLAEDEAKRQMILEEARALFPSAVASAKAVDAATTTSAAATEREEDPLSATASRPFSSYQAPKEPSPPSTMPARLSREDYMQRNEEYAQILHMHKLLTMQKQMPSVETRARQELFEEEVRDRNAIALLMRKHTHTVLGIEHQREMTAQHAKLYKSSTQMRNSHGRGGSHHRYYHRVAKNHQEGRAQDVAERCDAKPRLYESRDKKHTVTNRENEAATRSKVHVPSGDGSSSGLGMRVAESNSTPTEEKDRRKSSSVTLLPLLRSDSGDLNKHLPEVAKATALAKVPHPPMNPNSAQSKRVAPAPRGSGSRKGTPATSSVQTARPVGNLPQPRRSTSTPSQAQRSTPPSDGGTHIDSRVGSTERGISAWYATASDEDHDAPPLTAREMPSKEKEVASGLKEPTQQPAEWGPGGAPRRFFLGEDYNEDDNSSTMSPSTSSALSHTAMTTAALLSSTEVGGSSVNGGGVDISGTSTPSQEEEQTEDDDDVEERSHTRSRSDSIVSRSVSPSSSSSFDEYDDMPSSKQTRTHTHEDGVDRSHSAESDEHDDDEDGHRSFSTSTTSSSSSPSTSFRGSYTTSSSSSRSSSMHDSRSPSPAADSHQSSTSPSRHSSSSRPTSGTSSPLPGESPTREVGANNDDAEGPPSSGDRGESGNYSDDFDEESPQKTTAVEEQRQQERSGNDQTHATTPSATVPADPTAMSEGDEEDSFEDSSKSSDDDDA